mgnify:CR=1 FL=1
MNFREEFVCDATCLRRCGWFRGVEVDDKPMQVPLNQPDIDTDSPECDEYRVRSEAANHPRCLITDRRIPTRLKKVVARLDRVTATVIYRSPFLCRPCGTLLSIFRSDFERDTKRLIALKQTCSLGLRRQILVEHLYRRVREVFGTFHSRQKHGRVLPVVGRVVKHGRAVFGDSFDAKLERFAFLNT